MKNAAKSVNEFIAISKDSTSQFIRTMEDFSNSDFKKEFNLSQDVFDEFEKSLLFYTKSIDNDSEKAVVSMYLGGIVNHKNGPKANKLAEKVAAKFGMGTEYFLTCYHKRFYGDINTYQCMQSPYWVCNYFLSDEQSSKNVEKSALGGAVYCYGSNGRDAFGNHNWQPMRP